MWADVADLGQHSLNPHDRLGPERGALDPKLAPHEVDERPERS